jgi:hypothetical protein
VSDPRTGEIIKGHVTLGSLRVRQDYLIAEGLLAPYEDGKPVSKEMEQMALSRLKQLSAHEVGHTLGLAHSYASSSENFASVMDYPHPFARVENGKIRLDKAYKDGIGEWDKVSIIYGYQDFAKENDITSRLDSIIQNALHAGLTFLSDQDARPPGGAHPFAHLWDNGHDASEELNRVMDIRAIALKNFGEKNIKAGAPLATLEEVLVPMYFFHRYQTEASVKMIGGLNYRYALKGDKQPVTEFISAAQQTKVLNSLLKTIAPSSLMLPETLLKIIPPRPLGYTRSRELIKLRTDLTFDALSVAESAADMTVGLLLHPARATRLLEHHSRDQQQPSLESMIDKLISATYKAGTFTGYKGAVQMTVNDVVLRNLFKLALNEEAPGTVKSAVNFKIEQLKIMLTGLSNTTSDQQWKAHYRYAVSLIKQLEDSPAEFKQENPLPPPPGQPIGEAPLLYCDGFE